MGRTKRVATQKRIAPIYSVHPSVAMMRAWIAGLHHKTGRTLDEWVDLVQEEGPEPEPERRAWLKAKHGLWEPMPLGGSHSVPRERGWRMVTRKPISRRPKAMWR